MDATSILGKVYGKIQKLGLQNEYSSNPEFCHDLKKLPALAFAPVDNVSNIFDLLKPSLAHHEKATKFVKYFEVTYVGTKTRKLMFDNELWNVSYAMNDSIPKTTNHVEG